MSKKVLLVNGSPRKQNTYGLLIQIGEILERSGAETEILNLSELQIKACNGCDETCIHNLGCNTKDDDMASVLEKIKNCDGVVLGSPVYLRGVTSTFKAFADRTNVWFHNPDIAGKPVLLLATTESTGMKETMAFLDSLVTGFGARKGGAIARVGKAMSEPVTEKDMSGFLSLLEKDCSEYKPAMNELIIFVVQKILALKFGDGNKQFWEEKGWVDKCYYYPCKINPLKKLFSKFMFKVISNSMK